MNDVRKIPVRARDREPVAVATKSDTKPGNAHTLLYIDLLSNLFVTNTID